MQESPAVPQDMDEYDFLPESNDGSNQKEGEIYMSSALRALMTKSVLCKCTLLEMNSYNLDWTRHLGVGQ